MAVEKHITIRERQAEFIDDMNLTLSGVVQDHLDELIVEYDWQPSTNADVEA
jgi:hypothetical protein